MVHHGTDPVEPDGPTWRYIALGACALVLSIGGLAVGLWSESLDKRLDDIRSTTLDLRRIVESRADLPARVAEVETEHKAIKEQVRTLERQADRNGWK